MTLFYGHLNSGVPVSGTKALWFILCLVASGDL